MYNSCVYLIKTEIYYLQASSLHKINFQFEENFFAWDVQYRLQAWTPKKVEIRRVILKTIFDRQSYIPHLSGVHYVIGLLNRLKSRRYTKIYLWRWNDRETTKQSNLAIISLCYKQLVNTEQLAQDNVRKESRFKDIGQKRGGYTVEEYKSIRFDFLHHRWYFFWTLKGLIFWFKSQKTDFSV